MTRSENMSRIKSKNTSIEIMLRKELWKRGLRYRVNVSDVFGKPDIVFKKKKIAVFCDSEFWHGKKMLNGEVPKKNRDFWVKKLTSNIDRDKKVNDTLISEGWMVLRYWEKDIKTNSESIATQIENLIKSSSQ